MANTFYENQVNHNKAPDITPIIYLEIHFFTCEGTGK